MSGRRPIIRLITWVIADYAMVDARVDRLKKDARRLAKMVVRAARLMPPSRRRGRRHAPIPYALRRPPSPPQGMPFPRCLSTITPPPMISPPFSRRQRAVRGLPIT